MGAGADHTSCGHSHGQGHDHGHAHAVDTSTRDGRRRVAIAGILTFSFMFAEIIGGLVSQSLALLADAAHMMTDAASLALAWLGYKLSARPAEGQRTFGYGRYRILAAFVNGILLILLAGWIIVEAIERLVTPQPVMGQLLLAIACLGLVVNMASFYVLHGGDHDDLNLRGALWHVAGDLLGSVAAIIAALVIIWSGWMLIDPILSVLVACIVIVAGWRIMRASACILAEEAPAHIAVPQIHSALTEIIADKGVLHTLRVWGLTEAETHISVKLTGVDPADMEALRGRVHSVLTPLTDDERLIIAIEP